jgi:hypothetical protein
LLAGSGHVITFIEVGATETESETAFAANSFFSVLSLAANSVCATRGRAVFNLKSKTLETAFKARIYSKQTKNKCGNNNITIKHGNEQIGIASRNKFFVNKEKQIIILISLVVLTLGLSSTIDRNRAFSKIL